MTTEEQGGIYQIVNTVNSKRYIGSAVNLGARKRQHFYELRHNKHGNIYLQRSYNKHGEEAFSYEPLVVLDKENLLLFEQRFLDSMKPEYNISPTAGSQLGFKHSEHSIGKIIKNRKGKGLHDENWRAYMRAAMKDREFSIEHRNKISISKLGESNATSKLSSKDIPVIRERRDVGETCPSIAKDYPVGKEIIRRIGLRVAWEHIK